MIEKIKSIYTAEHLIEDSMDKQEVTNQFLLQKVENYIESIEKNSKVIGMGKRAQIINDFPDFNEEGDVVGCVCAKSNVFHHSQSHLQNGLKEEGRLQETARLILDQKRSDENEMANIPPVVAYIESDSGKEYLFMKAIKGKTLWRLCVEAAIDFDEELREVVIEKLRNTYNKKLDQLIDVEVDVILFNIFQDDEVLEKRVMQAAKNNPFLDSHQYRKMHNTIQALNGSGLYHRDLHLRNIMIDEKNEIFFIDFGTTLYDPQGSETNPWCMGRDNIAPQDVAIMPSIKSLIKFTDEEKEIRASQEKKKIIRKGNLLLKRFGVEINEENIGEVLAGNNAIFNNKLDGLTNSKDYNTIIALLTVLCELEKSLYNTITLTKRMIEDYAEAKFNESKTNIRSEKATLRREKMQFQQQVINKIKI